MNGNNWTRYYCIIENFNTGKILFAHSNPILDNWIFYCGIQFNAMHLYFQALVSDSFFKLHG